MIRILLFLTALIGLFPGCESSSGGTEIPNEISGSLHTASGPAAGARVKLFPVGYIPSDTSGPGPAYSAITRKDGTYSLSNVAPGQYNVLGSQEGLLSMADSVAVPDGDLELPPDTLRTPGSLVGTVRLEPQDDPRNATVQVLGTDYFTNVDQTGRFTLAGLAPGEYRLRVAVSLPEYVSLFQSVIVREGHVDTIPPLTPFFSGVPVVSGLKAAAGADGVIRLSWARTAYLKLSAYAVFRDDGKILLPARFEDRLGLVADTAYADTVYSRTPGPRQLGYSDTAAPEFTYGIRILDQTGKLGPAFGSATVTAVPPTLAIRSGKWKLALANAPFSPRSRISLVVFKDRLWAIGGMGYTSGVYTSALDAWSTADGTTWERALDSLPMYPGVFTAFKDSLWCMAIEGNPANTDFMNPVLNRVWKSADGAGWTRMAGPAPIKGRDYFAIVEFRNELWVGPGGVGIGGSVTPVPSVDFSSNGTTWSAAASPVDGSNPYPAQPSMAAFGGRLWISGGGMGMLFEYRPSPLLVSTSDGKAWTSNPAPAFGSRVGHNLVAHAGRLWVIGGYTARSDGSAAESDEVWSSPDGTAWTLVDAHAPFGKRAFAGAVSFQNRLWVVGGHKNGPEASLNDVWYMEP